MKPGTAVNANEQGAPSGAPFLSPHFCRLNRIALASFHSTLMREFEFMAKKSKLAARAAELEAAVAGLFTGTPAVAPAKKKRRKAKKAKVVKAAQKSVKKTAKKVKKAAKKAVKKAKKKAKKR
ncbi:MAG TPA: hypothetical protein VJM79_05170 [Rhizorhapis sp.]|nr:hypothetical protein [Rhizorhapis sp.]